MKHAVIMVVSLILVLCSMSVVSANEDITLNCNDAQIEISQGDIQMESIEINELETDYSNFNEEIDYNSNCNINENNLDDGNELGYLDSDDSDILEIPNALEIDNINNLYVLDNQKTLDKLEILNLNNLDNSNNLNNQIILNKFDMTNSKDLNDLFLNFKSIKINDETTTNVLNEKINSSNGYKTYNDANLLSLPLIELDLNDESIMVNFKEVNRLENILFSGNAGLNTVNLWNKISWINGLSSNDENATLIKRPLLTGFISNETIYNNYPQKDLPLEYTANNLLGVSRDFDDDAFIWYNQNPDEKALITVDMVNKSTDETLDLSLNEDLNSPYQIGVDASLKALDYFKSQGINIQKGYPYLYVLTSAGYVKINNTSTYEAIDGISDVLGLELNKNIFAIQNPLWKDLVFYYLWVNSTNIEDTLSYGLKYDVMLSQLVESDEVKKQGDYIIYMLFPHESDYPGQNYYITGGKLVINKFLNETNINSTNKTTNSTNSSIENKAKDIAKNSVSFKGNPYNLLYVIAAISILAILFSVVYKKRD